MTSKGLEMLEILKQRNGNLKINHKIGSRDIANQEIKEITQCFDNYVIPVIEKDLERLEKLEDIEKELDIDLIRAVELCKQVNSKKVVYTKEKWGIAPLKILDELDIELFSHRLYKNACGMYVSLDLYEYGKTWALTKEELENDK